jgi:hypothetical protein
LEVAPVAASAATPKEQPLLGEELASYRLPRVSLLGQLSFLMFITKLRFLPMPWTMPTSVEEVKQFTEAFTDAERMVSPNSPLNLFREMTLNAYHVNTAKVIGKGYEKYIKGITDAICDAIGKWSLLTVFAGVQINGPVGLVSPGCVLGPPLLPFILLSAPKETPMQLKYSMAIANAISTAWQTWQSGLTGTLAYPAFAAFPAPVAPPMPSIPLPLAAFNSPGESGLSPATLKNVMVGNFADPTAPHAPQLFESIAQAFNMVFQLFKLSTIVLTVLGMGPVPAFAPPVVPVAPVVGGTSLPLPGAIMTPPLGAMPGPTGEYHIALTPFGK